MATGKMLVIGAVLAQKNTFRATQIVDATGLSRPLVFKHLGNLVSTAHLEKTGPVYFVVNPDKLVRYFVDSNDDPKGERLTDSIFWDSKVTKMIKSHNTRVVRARGLDLPQSAEMKAIMVQEIDKAINALRNEKKWLTNASVEAKTAANQIWKNDIDEFATEVYKVMGELMELTCSRADYDEKLHEAITRIKEIEA